MVPADDVRRHVPPPPRNSADVTEAYDVALSVASKRKMIDYRSVVRNGISGEQARSHIRATDRR